jgi:hypothetical protein
VTDPVKAMRLGLSSDRGAPIEIIVDAETVAAFSGETGAAALMKAGRWIHQIHDDRPLATFCNIGVCYGCMMAMFQR